jgi:predicted sulfurtransferase
VLRINPMDEKMALKLEKQQILQEYLLMLFAAHTAFCPRLSQPHLIRHTYLAAGEQCKRCKHCYQIQTFIVADVAQAQLTLHCHPAQHSTAQHSTAQHSTAQHSTAQHSTAQHSTAQHSTAQHSTVALML